MGQTTRKATTRHRLLVYERLSNRLRSVPLMLTVLGLLLLGLGWLNSLGILKDANINLLTLLWEGQLYLIGLIVASLLLYILAVILGRNSYIEARPKALHVQAGLMALDISYKRVNQIRVSQVGTQHPSSKLKGADFGLMEPLLGTPCTMLDLQSWPWPGKQWVVRLWSKFMFSADKHSMMFIVKDSLLLNQQIESGRSVRQAKSSRIGTYLDPLERQPYSSPKKR